MTPNTLIRTRFAQHRAIRPEAILLLILIVSQYAAAEPARLPIRLAHDEWIRRLKEQPEPLMVPVDAGWTISGADTATPGSIRVVTTTTVNAELSHDVSVDAQTYNSFSITMSVTAGIKGVLGWQNDTMDDHALPAAVTFAVRPGSGLQTYTLHFSPGEQPAWTGRIGRIRLEFAAADADIHIDSVQFAFVPPEAPGRVTLNQQTHYVLPAGELTRTAVLPEDPILECWLGVRGTPAVSRVRFAVRITSDAAETEVFEKHVDVDAESTPRWHHILTPLTPFSGKEVGLSLVSDPPGAGLWGNPVVFSKQDKGGIGPIILISCDTARADHFSCYGYSRATTPFLDEFRKDSVLFLQAITTSTWTLPSHLSMLTGLTEKTHGVGLFASLPEDRVTLPEVLAPAGFLSAGFTGMTGNLDPSFGFAQGFDIYNTPTDYVRSIFHTLPLVKDWVTQHAMRGFFLFFHNFDIHSLPGVTALKDSPYGPHDPKYLLFSKDFAESDSPVSELERWFSGTDTQEVFEQPIAPDALAYGIAGYDDAIRSVDDGVRDLVSTLKALGLYDSAMIIVTSDHGEEFGEHGRYGHHAAYEECCHVPLIIKFPGNRFSGQTIDDMVQLVDLFPTVVDAVGLSPIPHLDGKSLVPLLEGTAAPETSVADIMATTQLGVRTQHAKMLVNLPHLEPEYYQLDTDAEEVCDLAAKHEEAAQCVRKRYARILDNTGWVITLYPGREPWNTDLIFQLPHGVASLMEIFGLETLDFERDQRPDFPVSSNGASASLCITQPYRMFIRPGEGRNPLLLSLDSTTDFEVFIGRRDVLRAKHFESVLDLQEYSFDRPPRLPRVPREDPAIVVWYGTYDSAASQTPELPDELIENLKSQGYLK